jgi:hypothetical protein
MVMEGNRVMMLSVVAAEHQGMVIEIRLLCTKPPTCHTAGLQGRDPNVMFLIKSPMTWFQRLVDLD